jgi:uncharacterized membrane protein
LNKRQWAKGFAPFNDFLQFMFVMDLLKSVADVFENGMYFVQWHWDQPTVIGDVLEAIDFWIEPIPTGGILLSTFALALVLLYICCFNGSIYMIKWKWIQYGILVLLIPGWFEKNYSYLLPKWHYIFSSSLPIWTVFLLAASAMRLGQLDYKRTLSNNGEDQVLINPQPSSKLALSLMLKRLYGTCIIYT